MRALIAVAVLALAGCGTPPETELQGSVDGFGFHIITIPLDGTPLTCVMVSGRPSCDWQGWHADRMPK